MLFGAALRQLDALGHCSGVPSRHPACILSSLWPFLRSCGSGGATPALTPYKQPALAPGPLQPSSCWGGGLALSVGSAARGVDRYLLRVLSGAAVDGRQLARLQLPANCVCGASDYDRHHATFDCPTVPWMLEKRSADERRTLVPLVPIWPFAARLHLLRLIRSSSLI